MSDNHGNTPAAWTAVAVALVGFAVGGAGLMFRPINYPVFWVGVGLVAVAGVLFVVLAKFGFHETEH